MGGARGSPQGPDSKSAVSLGVSSQAYEQILYALKERADREGKPLEQIIDELRDPQGARTTRRRESHSGQSGKGKATTANRKRLKRDDKSKSKGKESGAHRKAPNDILGQVSRALIGRRLRPHEVGFLMVFGFNIMTGQPMSPHQLPQPSSLYGTAAAPASTSYKPPTSGAGSTAPGSSDPDLSQTVVAGVDFRTVTGKETTIMYRLRPTVGYQLSPTESVLDIWKTSETTHAQAGFFAPRVVISRGPSEKVSQTSMQSFLPNRDVSPSSGAALNDYAKFLNEGANLASQLPSEHEAGDIIGVNWYPGTGPGGGWVDTGAFYAKEYGDPSKDNPSHT